MKSKNAVGLHVVSWIALYLLWLALFQRHAFTLSRTATVQFCFLFFIIANFYFNIFFVIPRFLYSRHYVLFALFLLTGIGTSAVLRVPIASYLNDHFFLLGKPQPNTIDLFLNSFINIFIWVICLLAGKLIIDRIRLQRYVENMEKEKNRTELDFLNAQFNPHFLFNSINSIYGHIDKKNTSARSMLLTFSDMLRYQLYECNTEKIGIEKELNYIRNYMALQQSRQEESLLVRLQINDEVSGFDIAPLLFITFIENCFKFVSNDDERENRVEVYFTRKENVLTFRTYNTKDMVQSIDPKAHGIGISNVKRRLELLYPDQHDLSVHEQDRWHEVVLQITLS